MGGEKTGKGRGGGGTTGEKKGEGGGAVSIRGGVGGRQKLSPHSHNLPCGPRRVRVVFFSVYYIIEIQDNYY